MNMYLQDSNSNSVSIAKKTTSLRKKLIVSLGLILSVLMLLVSFFVTNHNDMTASAETTTTPTQTEVVANDAVYVDEIWDNKNMRFNTDNLTILLQYIYGGEGDVRPSYIEQMAANRLGVEELNAQVLPAGMYNGVNYTSKTADQDIVVTIAGAKWTPYMLSKVHTGETLLDFKLIEGQEKPDVFEKYINICDYFIEDYNNLGMPEFFHVNLTTVFDKVYNFENAYTILEKQDNQSGIYELNGVRLIDGFHYKAETQLTDEEGGAALTGSGIYSDNDDTVVRPRAVVDGGAGGGGGGGEYGYGSGVSSYVDDWSINGYYSASYYCSFYGTYAYQGTSKATATVKIYSKSSNALQYTSYPTYTYSQYVYDTDTYYWWAKTKISAASMSSATMTLSTSSYTYDGTAKQPTVTLTYNGKTVPSGLYSVSYSNNTVPGTATVTVTGISYTFGSSCRKGSETSKTAKYASTSTSQIYLSGSISKTFTISKVSMSSCTVTLGAGLTYNAKSQTKTVSSVKYNSQTISSSNYTITGNTGTNAGSYTMKLTGKNYATGTKTVTWSIASLPVPDCQISITCPTYTGKSVSPTVSLKTPGGTTVSSSYYTLSETTSAVDDDPDLYYIQINGKTNLTSYTQIDWSVLPRPISSCTVTMESRKYNGKSQSPGVSSVVYSGTTIGSSNYSVSGTAQTNVGSSYTATVSGKNNLSSSVSKTWSIVESSDWTINFNTSSFTFNGKAQGPIVTIKISTTTISSSNYMVYGDSNTAAGTYTVTVEGEVNLSGTKTKTYTISAISASRCTINWSGSSYPYTGSAICPTVSSVVISSTTVSTSYYSCTYSYSNNTNVGTGSVTATFSGGNITESVTKTFSITAASISSASKGTLSNCSYYATSGSGDKWCTSSSCTYNTHEHQRFQTLTYNTKTLTSGTDYTILYSNNIDKSTNTAIATVTYTGIGNFTGTTSTSWTINALNIGNCSKSYTSTYTYTRSAQGPSSFTLYLNTSSCCTIPTSNYSVSGNSQKYPGTYTITFTGSGNLTGTTTGTFTINKRPVYDSVVSKSSVSSQEYTAGDINPTVTVTHSNNNDTYTLVKGTDYTVSCSNNVNVGTATLTITGAGSYYSGSWSTTFSIVARALNNTNFSISTTDTSKTYTGSALTSTVTLKYGSNTIPATYYTATWNNNTNVGTPTITITAKKGSDNITNLSGSATFTSPMKITARPLSDSTVSMASVAAQTYTANAITPTPALTFTGAPSTLTSGTDFTYSYSNNINCGANGATNSATVTATAIENGNFSGSRSVTFTISPRALSSCSITLGKCTNENCNSTSHTYLVVSGTEQSHTPSVTLQYITTLSPDYYSVAYTNNKNAGTATVTVTPKTTNNITNLSGSTSTTFTIATRSISSATIASISAQTYTANAITPTPAVTYGGKTLVSGTDFTYSYSNNTNCGANGATNSATVTITGKGNFSPSSSKSTTFTISPRALSSCSITLGKCTNTNCDSTSHTYLVVSGTAQSHTPGVTLKYSSTTLSTNYYSVTYSNNVNAGTATVTINPKTTSSITNLSGSTSTTFSIAARAISAATKSGFGTCTYTGSTGHNRCTSATCYYNTHEHARTQTLTYNGMTLGTADYSYSYKDNKNKGTATVTYKAVDGGNYTGETTATWTIAAMDINNVIFEYANSYTYNGSKQGPTSFTAYLKSGCSCSISTSDGYSYAHDASYAGTYTITFTGSGNLTGTNTKNSFTIKQKSIADGDTTDGTASVEKDKLSACLGYDTSKGSGGHSLCGTNCMYNTHAHTRNQTLTYNSMTLNDSDYTISYSNNVLKGTATVTYTGKGNYKGTASRTWTIAALDISKVTFDYDDSFVYNTSAVGPTSFTGYLYSKTCCTIAQSGTYGSYSWSGNQAVDVGTYYVTFTGTGNLTGTKSTDSYVISPRSIQDTTVTIDPIYQLYKHGTAITIDEFKKVLSLDYNNDSPMAYNTDYTFVLSNNTAVYEDTTYATANPPTVTITGKGNYTGTITRNFLIYANNLDQTNECKVTLPYTSHVYTGHNIEPIVTIKWEGVLYYRDNNGVTQTSTYSSSSPLTLVKGTDYDISYTSNQNVGTATITMTGKNRFSGTITRTFNITAANIAYIPQSQITLSEDEYTYTGLAHNPTPTVKYQHSNLCATLCGTNRCSTKCYNDCSNDAIKTLVNNTDYTYAIENNINAGTALVTITGKGNYTGTNHTSFKILPRNMSYVVINGISSAGYPYTGSAITPDFTATYTRSTGATPQTLVYMQDYTISYSDNVEAGNATLTLTGIGNFTLTQSATFKIIAAVIEDIENDNRLSIEPLGSYVYTGSAITPEIHMTFNTKPMVLNDAYTVSYSNNTNVGTATATITGIGNFAGTTFTRTFEITKKSISDLDVTITYTDRYEHTGSSITPTLSITYNSNTLVKGTDYNLDVTGNRDVGQGSFTITGKGNYEGSETRNFNIFSYTMTKLSATVDTSATTYRGKNVAVKPTITLNDPLAKFTVEYQNNYRAGTAKAIITGTDGYTGTIETVFTISEANIAAASVNAISADAYFTDTEYNPDLRLEFTALNAEGTDTQTTILERDIDFRVKSIEVDTVNFRGVATIEGIDNFVGTREVEFNIVARDISTVDVNSLSDVTYTGEEIRPNITLTYSGVNLVEGEDYILEYYDNINSGTAYVDIVGINKFGGIRTLSFTIKQIKLTVNPTYNASEVYYEYDALPQLIDESVAEYGRFEWTPPYFLEGTNDYIWKFVPFDKVNYEVISGEETFTAIDVYVERIITELTGDVDYYAYSEFDKSGIQVTVQYSNNRYQVLEDNQYTISLNEGEYLQAGDELTVYVQEGDIVVGQGMGFAIQARPLTVTFDGYSNLTETDSNQTISVDVDGLLEGYEDAYSIVYYNLSNNTIGNSITTAGSYKVEVILSDSNYAITGASSVTFNVKTKALSNETVSITSESGFEGGASVNLTTYETAEELVSAYSLSNIDFGGKYLRAYSFDVVSEGITIANNTAEDTQTVNVKLTAEGINSTDNLKLYAVRQGALVALDYQVVDGKFVFNCELSDVVVFVEEMEEKSFNWSVLVWSLVGLLVVGAVIGTVLYFDIKNKKEASKKTTKKTAKKSTK